MKLVQAAPADLDTVIEIYAEGDEWWQSMGFHDRPMPPQQVIRDGVAAGITDGRVYLCQTEARRSVGTFRLLWSDPDVWPDDDGEAGYVHGVIIRNDVRGQGVGVQMLEWAADLIRAKGRRFIRLDTDASNPKLCRYYERLGFESRGVVPQRYHMAARYEKQA
jgi:ribosomal protein S18 acetylase RimI-like enzyme